jgi:hypothetical protein
MNARGRKARSEAKQLRKELRRRDKKKALAHSADKR